MPEVPISILVTLIVHCILLWQIPNRVDFIAETFLGAAAEHDALGEIDGPILIRQLVDFLEQVQLLLLGISYILFLARIAPKPKDHLLIV